MPFKRSIASIATEEALRTGMPLTVLEGLLYYGYGDLPKLAMTLKRKGGVPLETRAVPLVEVMARVEAALGAPVPCHPLVRYAHGVTQSGTPIGSTVTEWYRPKAKAEVDALAALAADMAGTLAGLSPEDRVALAKVLAGEAPAEAPAP